MKCQILFSIYMALRLVLWVKFPADDTLKYCLNFPRKDILTFHANWETIYMKCQIPVFCLYVLTFSTLGKIFSRRHIEILS